MRIVYFVGIVIGVTLVSAKHHLWLDSNPTTAVPWTSDGSGDDQSNVASGSYLKGRSRSDPSSQSTRVPSLPNANQTSAAPMEPIVSAPKNTNHSARTNQDHHHRSKHWPAAKGAQQPGTRPSTGRHVCTHEETVSRPVRVVESYCKPAYKSFTQRCANGTLCTAFRVQYETIYRTTVKYQMVTERKHACCPGWTHTTKHTHGCTQPVCSKGCKHGGTCIKPDVCQCLPGYTGPSCETDIDECSNNQYNKCTQSCNNTPGSYQCTCHQGFQLQEDGRSCKFQLESVPELQELLRNYESMAQRLTQLEQETHERAVPATESSAAVTQSPSSAAEGSAEPSIETVDKSEYESTIARLMQQIFTLEDKVQKLNEFNIYLNNTRSMSDLPSDSLSSLSEQVAILEERLADCTCKP